MTSFIPHEPTPTQSVFMMLDDKEAFYGGAAGGGKSDALLMAALQYVDHPGYAALILRKTYAELSKPEALMDRAQSWLSGKAHWKGTDNVWVFPSEAKLQFGYIASDKDRYQFQSSAYQFIGWDELTEWESDVPYTWMFSRLRRLKGVNIPLRVRAASNPGGLGHEWVRARLVDDTKIPFIAAKLRDNPYLDAESYIESLKELDEITLQQLLNGDWTARMAGTKFRREWFEFIDYNQLPTNLKRVRYWDLAATEPGFGKDPCWTAGVYLAMDEWTGIYYVLDVDRLRSTPAGVQKRIRGVADMDGDTVAIAMEQEPGASGVNVIDQYAREILKDRIFMGHKPTGDKETRANVVSSKAERGYIKIVRGPWNKPFVEELEAFPNGQYKDQVDALSGAYVKVLEADASVHVTPMAPASRDVVVRRGDLTFKGQKYVDQPPRG